MIKRFSFFFLLLLLPNLSLRAETFQQRLASLQARLAADPTNTTLLFQLGDLCHDEGAEGNEEAVRLAEGYFKRLMELDKHHAMARVLYGSVLTMRARDAFWPFNRMALLKRGLKEMDAAVEMAPQDPAVRFARVLNNFYMPDFLDRQDIVAADLLLLWKKVQEDPAALSTELKQEIALYRGRWLKKKNSPEQARQVWQSGLQFDPQSSQAAELRKELDRLVPPSHPPNSEPPAATGKRRVAGGKE